MEGDGRLGLPCSCLNLPRQTNLNKTSRLVLARVICHLGQIESFPLPIWALILKFDSDLSIRSHRPSPPPFNSTSQDMTSPYLCPASGSTPHKSYTLIQISLDRRGSTDLAYCLMPLAVSYHTPLSYAQPDKLTAMAIVAVGFPTGMRSRSGTLSLGESRL